MAVLQIHVIRATGGRNQLNDRIKYIMNPEKTACKGFHSFFGIKDTLTSGFTCACDEAYQQMMETKQHEKKTDKVLGYHYIQSFKPGEVTPEEAHQVGCKFIERCFAEDFEVVIGTHTDHAHIHNHIILNSVSFVDGHKFQSTPASFYKLRTRFAERITCRLSTNPRPARPSTMRNGKPNGSTAQQSEMRSGVILMSCSSRHIRSIIFGNCSGCAATKSSSMKSASTLPFARQTVNVLFA